MAKMVTLESRGIIRFLRYDVVVAIDKAHDCVDYFVKNMFDQKVECYHISEDYINTFPGDEFMTRASECWTHICDEDVLSEEHGWLETLCLEFWDDIVVPMKKCYNVTIIGKNVSKG